MGETPASTPSSTNYYFNSELFANTGTGTGTPWGKQIEFDVECDIRSQTDGTLTAIQREAAVSLTIKFKPSPPD